MREDLAAIPTLVLEKAPNKRRQREKGTDHSSSSRTLSVLKRVSLVNLRTQISRTSARIVNSVK